MIPFSTDPPNRPPELTELQWWVLTKISASAKPLSYADLEEMHGEVTQQQLKYAISNMPDGYLEPAAEGKERRRFFALDTSNPVVARLAVSGLISQINDIKQLAISSSALPKTLWT